MDYLENADKNSSGECCGKLMCASTPRHFPLHTFAYPNHGYRTPLSSSFSWCKYMHKRADCCILCDRDGQPRSASSHQPIAGTSVLSLAFCTHLTVACRTYRRQRTQEVQTICHKQCDATNINTRLFCVSRAAVSALRCSLSCL